MTTPHRRRSDVHDGRRAMVLGGLLVLALATAATGCGGGTEPRVDPASAHTPAPSSTSTIAPASTTTPSSTTAPGSTTAPAATRGGARLPAPVEDAAARVLMIGFGGKELSPSTYEQLLRHDWGGVVLGPANSGDEAQVGAMVQQVIAAAAAGGRRAPLVAASQPGGVANAVPVGPPVQSTLTDAARAQLAARQAAGHVRKLGIRMVLAPSADIAATGGPWEGRAFSDDAEAVAALAQAAVRGWMRGGVAPAAGHFPGEGAASGDPALEPATVGLSLDELRQRDMRPFAALASRAPAMQLSAATFVGFDGVTPATLLPEAVALLREELHFDGVIVSGDLAAASLATGQPVGEAAVEALRAGCDLLWIPGGADDQEQAWQAIVRAVREGKLPRARLADALRRVDALRDRYGVR